RCIQSHFPCIQSHFPCVENHSGCTQNHFRCIPNHCRCISNHSRCIFIHFRLSLGRECRIGGDFLSAGGRFSWVCGSGRLTRKIQDSPRRRRGRGESSRNDESELRNL